MYKFSSKYRQSDTLNYKTKMSNGFFTTKFFGEPDGAPRSFSHRVTPLAAPPLASVSARPSSDARRAGVRDSISQIHRNLTLSTEHWTSNANCRCELVRSLQQWHIVLLSVPRASSQWREASNGKQDRCPARWTKHFPSEKKNTHTHTRRKQKIRALASPGRQTRASSNIRARQKRFQLCRTSKKKEKAQRYVAYTYLFIALLVHLRFPSTGPPARSSPSCLPAL